MRVCVCASRARRYFSVLAAKLGCRCGGAAACPHAKARMATAGWLEAATWLWGGLRLCRARMTTTCGLLCLPDMAPLGGVRTGAATTKPGRGRDRRAG